MKNSTLPLVTIGAVNYNCVRFVLETLESIRLQTYPNIELIIVDDCSTDGSLDIIITWLKEYTMPYRLIIHKENKGLKAGLEDILNCASGKYLSLISTDDILIFDKIDDQVKLIESFDNEVGLVYGDSMMIDENGKIIHNSMFQYYRGENFVPPSGNVFRDIVNDFYFYSQASLINLELLKKSEFTLDNNIISEDWDMQLCLSRNYEIYGQNKICTKYRRVSNSITASNWNELKMHKVWKSHLYMFNKYLKSPLNTKSDNIILLDKIRLLYWKLFESKSFTRQEKVKYFYVIFKQTKTIRNLLILIKISLSCIISNILR